MKGYCYIALIIGFFVFYQQNPMYALVMIALFVIVYLYFKSRKAGSSGGKFGFFSGKGNQQHDSRMDDLITLMMIQQLINSPAHDTDNHISEDSRKTREAQIEKSRQEVLALLDEE